jgi:hypothetical protein
MGGAKREWEEAQDRGWYSSENFVCAECVDDPFLKALIQENVEHDTCDYCEQVGKNIAAPMDILLECLADTLHYHFADPNNSGVSYVSAEGGWQANTVNTDEALLGINFSTESEKLFDDVTDAFTEDTWVEATAGHWLRSPLNKVYMQSWQSFANTVKHESRYFFGSARVTTPDPDFDDPADDSPPDILAELNKLARASLVQKLDAGITFHRARLRAKGSAWPLDAAQLGAPPKECSSAGRMNPAGISYLYLAFDEATALAEVVDPAPADYAVGTFTTTRSLTVLNLADLPRVPSIFDPNQRDERELILFLRGFTRAISRPVKKDGREHVNYVPSQVVSEYFRLIYETHPASADAPAGALDGIVYQSAARPGSRNLVLFPTGSRYQHGFDQAAFVGAAVRRITNVSEVRPEPADTWLVTDDD